MEKITNNQTGAIGEEAVIQFLSSRNAEIVGRNWRIREGEIDIIALASGGVFSFVEVKTRRTAAFGHPLEAINPVKAYRMQRLALAWLATHGCFGCDYQIDAAAVLLSADGSYSIDYRENIV
jgi:putative endonuclease